MLLFLYFKTNKFCLCTKIPIDSCWQSKSKAMNNHHSVLSIFWDLNINDFFDFWSRLFGHMPGWVTLRYYLIRLFTSIKIYGVKKMNDVKNILIRNDIYIYKLLIDFIAKLQFGHFSEKKFFEFIFSRIYAFVFAKTALKRWKNWDIPADIPMGLTNFKIQKIDKTSNFLLLIAADGIGIFEKVHIVRIRKHPGNVEILNRKKDSQKFQGLIVNIFDFKFRILDVFVYIPFFNFDFL